MTILCGLSGVDGTDLVGAVGGDVRVAADLAEVGALLQADPEIVLIVLGPGVELAAALEFAQRQRVERATLGVVLVRAEVDVELLTQALRCGVREVVAGGDPAGLVAACERSLALSRAAVAGGALQGDAPRATVVTVFSAKGGCGKTTTATNLAVALAADGEHRICLVDLDLAFGDVAISLQLAPDRTIGDAIDLVSTLDTDTALGLLTPWRKGLDCVLAPVAPGDAQRVPAGLVTRLLEVLRTRFDYVIVDTPAEFSEHVLAALDLSDQHILLTTPDLPALKNLRLTLDMLDMLGYERDARAVVLNRAGSKVGITDADVERVAAARPAVQLPSSRDVPASVNRGVPLFAAEPDHRFSAGIRRLAQWCAERAGATTTLPAPRRGGLRVPLRSRRPA